jgi:hypothetical protein
MFRPGSSELVVGRATARGFEGAGLGGSLRFAQRDWTVVGVFDAGNSGFDSEIWGDSEQMLQAFRRLSPSTVVLRLQDPAGAQDFIARAAADPRLTLDLKPERQFYEEQSRGLAIFINVLGLALSAIFSVGAIVGAMITMYAAVASRTGEIATLRAARSDRGPARPAGGLLHAGREPEHHQLPDLLRGGLPFRADPRDCRTNAALRARHGPGRRLPAGLARGVVRPGGGARR